jgi:hypothetical protein
MLSYAGIVSSKSNILMSVPQAKNPKKTNKCETCISRNMVNECKISLNYSLRDLPPNVGLLMDKSNFFKNVEIFHNSILDEIMKNYQKIISNGTALIIVDGSRYTIEHVILNNNLKQNFNIKQNFLVKQYVNHYDSKQEKLIPVYVRYVWISLK